MTYDDDTLILYYYGEGLDRVERARIDGALRDDPTLALRYVELTATLDRLRMPADVQPPATAVHRWQTGLARAARLETGAARRPWWHAWPLRAGAAFALLAALAVGVDGWRHGDPEPDDALVAVQPAPTPPAIASSLERGIQLHLRQTGALVDALASTDVDRRRTALADALQRNRVYERSADARDNERLARILRAFDAPLSRLADARIDASTFQTERERLAFELNAVESRLAQSPGRYL